MKQKTYYIRRGERQALSFIMYHEPNGLLAAVFSTIPLAMQQHCIKVGAVAGLLAEHVPVAALPEGLQRVDYINALRYAGFYHDIGVYLAPNRLTDYPTEGRKILENELGVDRIAEPIRRVILEAVGCMGERCDGLGYPKNLMEAQIPLHASLCAIANAIDAIVAGRPRRLSESAVQEINVYMRAKAGSLFLPAATDIYLRAEPQIVALYRKWKDAAPLWKYNDLTWK